MTTFPVGVLFEEPYYKPLDQNGKPMPFATLVFLRAGPAGPLQLPATVYQDGALTTPYAPPIQADSNGRFNPIYLTPGIAYRVQLFDQFARRMQDNDTYVAQPPLFIGTVVKPADTVRSLNTTPVLDPDLIITIPYPGLYRFDYQLGFSIASIGANPNLNMSINYSGELNTTLNQSQQAVFISNITGTASLNNCGSITINAPSVVYNLQNQDPTVNFFWIRGYVYCSTGLGNLILPWGQGTSNAATLTLRRGSTVSVRQVI